MNQHSRHNLNRLDSKERTDLHPPQIPSQQQRKSPRQPPKTARNVPIAPPTAPPTATPAVTRAKQSLAISTLPGRAGLSEIREKSSWSRRRRRATGKSRGTDRAVRSDRKPLSPLPHCSPNTHLHHGSKLEAPPNPYPHQFRARVLL